MDTSIKRLYVLELKNGKYYVGTTYNLQRRFQEHVDGLAGSAWTRKYAPLAIAYTEIVDDPLQENTLTRQMMFKYGIDNVRGGSYCKIDLPDFQKKSLRAEQCSATDTCFKCGRPGHFAAQCHLKAVPKKDERKTTQRHPKAASKRDDGCCRCGRSGHFANACYARTHVDGDLLIDSSEEDDDAQRHPKAASKRDEGCCRCGRSGHFANACYARTHVDGDLLIDSSEEDDDAQCQLKTASKRDEGCCRCGRSGHFANACYARTDVDGRVIGRR